MFSRHAFAGWIPTIRSRAMNSPRHRSNGRAGFTLVELIVVIVVLGILSAAVSVFVANPVRAYFETMRRAQMTDAADLVVRRITRELQMALPNSVRISASASTVFMEFIPVNDAGRYRAAVSGGNEPTGTDALDITDLADTTFQVLGQPVTVNAGAQLVIFNLGSGDLDAYAGANRRVVATAPGSVSALSFLPTAATFPADSPEHRFYLVSKAVTFTCTPAADGTGTIERFAGYDLQAAQPTNAAAAPLATASHSLVVDHVSACSFVNGNTLASINTVDLALKIADGGEAVTLQAQVALQNSP